MITMDRPIDQLKAAGVSGADLAGGGHGYHPGGPITAPKPLRKQGGSVPDLAVVAIAVACAVFGGIWGYTLGLEDGKATRAATAASRPVVKIPAPTATVTVPGPPLATVTATVSVERKPREKSKPMPVILTLPGKYAVGIDVRPGEWVSLTNGSPAGCSWDIIGADGKVRAGDMLYVNTDDKTTSARILPTDKVFEFRPGCDQFELVR